MNEDSTTSGSSTGNTTPAPRTRGRRRYGRLLADTQLATLFSHIVNQPIPDEFLDLLRRIDARLPQA